MRLPAADRLRGLALALLAAAAASALAALYALMAYRVGPLVAAGALVSLAAVPMLILRPVLGIAAAALVLPLEYVAAETAGGFGISPSEGILLLTAAAAAPRLLWSLRLRDVHPAILAFGALVVVSFTGLLVAAEPFTSARITLMWIAFLVATLVVATSSRDDLQLVVVSLALAGGLLGAVALIGLGSQEAVAGGAIVINRAQAGFSHPTALALVLVLTFPIAFAAGLRGPPALRPLMLAAAALALTGLLLTHTRGAIIGGIVAILVMMRWAPFRRLAATFLVAVLVVTAINLDAVTEAAPVTVVGERLGTLASLKTRNDDRADIWGKSPTIFAENALLGVGQGNFSIASRRHGVLDVGGAPFDHAHNLLINVALELGLVGLIVLLVFLVQVIRAGLSALRNSGPADYPLVLALAASLAGLLVNSVTEYPLRTNVIMALIMIEIGALIAFARLAASGPGAPRPGAERRS
jgi:putative inorganic carbon (hco3(-)) transporter